jgi:TolA-binding protein
LAASVAAIYGSASAQRRPATHPPQVTIAAPLPELLGAATTAFAAGDYTAAAHHFSEAARFYGDEPVWQEETLQRRLLPLMGFARLQAGDASGAAESLGTFLERFPDDVSQRAFALFAHASALRLGGDPERAAAQFAAYAHEHAGTPQAALAHMQRADVLFELGRPDDALAALEDVRTHAPSESLRIQARLEALDKAVELGRDDDALRLLLGEPWSVHAMPEIGRLAFAAMQVGDRLLATDKPALAVQAYRLVPPRRALIEAQRERLDELQARFDERVDTVGAGEGALWVDFYRKRIARIRAGLEGMEAAEDHTAALLLRTGQAMLLAGRPREARLAFERLATDDSVSTELRREAHHRWILAACEMAAWGDALVLARDFRARHPAAEETPEILHLVGRAHLEERRFADAVEAFGEIVDHHAGSPAAPRARFSRGWARLMQEDFAGARADFERYREDHPTGIQFADTGLWRALTFFFERRLPEALAALDALRDEPGARTLAGEIDYRRATVLYAMREYTRAAEELHAYLDTHPTHARRPEALVLLGDVRMGEGRLDEARACFATVPPEAVDAFVYGVFQTGKILRAEERHADMATHFRAYVARTDMPVHPRTSEALHWIGWAEEQQGNPAAALPVYLDVLERFGDDPAAGEVSATLSALHRLVQRMQRAPSHTRDPSSFDPRAARLLDAGFDAWLDDRRAAAAAAGEDTRLARLALFAADRHLARKEPHQAEALVLEIAGTIPPAALDAPALARVGLALLDIGSPEALRHFEHLLHTYPASFERAAAYHGFATDAARRRKTDDALRWIARFEQETPTHPLAPRTALLAATTLETAQRHDEAARRFEDILRLRSARGRIHAEALMGLARCAMAVGDARRAIAYCQRVYNLHRAQRDLGAEAYLVSASLFADLGDPSSAAATYREMLAQGDIGTTAQREQAMLALEALPPPSPTPLTGETALPEPAS